MPKVLSVELLAKNSLVLTNFMCTALSVKSSGSQES